MYTQPLAAFYDSPLYPDAVPNGWAEGTGMVAQALLRLQGNSRADHLRYLEILQTLNCSQWFDGSLLYVEVEDPTYDLEPYPSVIGSCWYILAQLEGGLWGDTEPVCL